MLDKGKIEQSPKRIKADEYILELAKAKYPRAKVVTNDSFSEYTLLERYSDIIMDLKRLQNLRFTMANSFLLAQNNDLT